MIIKGSERGGSAQLAAHLLRTDENDHVEIMQIKGFLTDDLNGALKEAYAISRGTRCKKFLFSASLSPPETACVTNTVFESTADLIEQRLGLEGHSRALIAHEKNGRRHVHAVWLRINPDTMTAANLPYFKIKLREISRQLYIDHDWSMPLGLVNSEEANPLNFSLAEWQQAKRLKLDARQIKEVFQDCWAVSDGLRAFQNALESRGFYLAKGDRRGYVAVDWRGEVYSVGRWCGKRSRMVEAKLGKPDNLPSVDSVLVSVKQRNAGTQERLSREANRIFRETSNGLTARKTALVQYQRSERETLKSRHRAIWLSKLKALQARLPTGLKAVWFRLTGRYFRIRTQNAQEAAALRNKLRQGRETMIDAQLQQRRKLRTEMDHAAKMHRLEMRHIADTFTPSDTMALRAPRQNKSIQ